MKVSKIDASRLAALPILVLGIFNGQVGFAVFGFCLLVILAPPIRQAIIQRATIAVLIAAFLVGAWLAGGSVRAFLSRDLPLYTYNNDWGVLYKTYLLLGQDFNYYDAYQLAQLGRFDQPLVPGDIWGWRLPTLFFLWQILPGTSGISIYLLYLALAAGTLYSAYLIGVRYLGPNLGILSPYLLFPYLSYGARDQVILATEWWGMFAFTVGLFFLIWRRYFWAIIFLSLTVLVREVYILPTSLLAIYALVKRRDLVVVFALPLVAFGLLYLFHIIRTSYYIDAWGTLLAPRVLGSGWFFVQQTLAFASWEYLSVNFRPFLVFLGLATFGLVCLFIRKRDEEAIIWALAVLSFPLSFLRFGTVPYNDYWGIIYVPQVLILAPLALLAIRGGSASTRSLAGRGGELPKK